MNIGLILLLAAAALGCLGLALGMHSSVLKRHAQIAINDFNDTPDSSHRWLDRGRKLELAADRWALLGAWLFVAVAAIIVGLGLHVLIESL